MTPRPPSSLRALALWVLVGSSLPAALRGKEAEAAIQDSSETMSPIDRNKENGLQLPKLCKFCDIKVTTCSNQYQCKSNCNITSICERNNEVCAAVWRRNDENVTLETICHDPQKPLYGHMLDDTSSEQCLMKEKKDNGGLMFMCSCTDEECNDVLIFSTDSKL